MTPTRRALTVWTIAAAMILSAGRGGAQDPSMAFPPALNASRAEGLLAAAAGAPYVAGELLVKFRAGAPPVRRAGALSVLRDSAQISQLRTIGDAYLISTPGEADAEAAAATLQRQPEIEWARPNYIRPLLATPNDPSYARQWNFDAIGLPRAWDINPGASSDVTVAVIDSGVATVTNSFTFRLWTGSRLEDVSIPFRVNPDLATARILPGRDFVLWDGPVLDLDGHGTHVAGTVLQETNNSTGVAGIAYNAKLMPLKACVGYWDLQIIRGFLGLPGFVDPADNGFCPDSSVAEAIRYAADNGAEIINISIGGPDASPVYLDALRYAVQRGVFVAIAAGNEFEDRNPVIYPAAYAPEINGVVAVGAIGRSKRRAPYSTTGSYVELAAPGGDSTDGGLNGVVWQVGLFFPDFLPPQVIRPRFDRYAEIPSEGTSMAAPHVAGVAALLYSQGITNPGAVEAALKHFATDLGPPGRDDEYGHGLINPRASLSGMGLVR